MALARTATGNFSPRAAPPRVGDRYRVKANVEYSSGGVGYFREFDGGTVCSCNPGDRLFVAWDRTERVTAHSFEDLLAKAEALGERANMVLEVGNRVRARLGQSAEDPSGVPCFKEHDMGYVAGIDRDAVYVTWDRTERVSSCGRVEWGRQFKRIPHFGKARTELEVGERVWALAGSTFTHAGRDVFKGHDTGTVASATSTSVSVSWDRTRLCFPHPAETWLRFFKLLPSRKARTTLEVGDQVESLSGQELFVKGVEIYREFCLGVVTKISADKVWIAWNETGQLSEHHPVAWLQQLRLIYPEVGGDDQHALGEAALPILYTKVRARPGREYSDVSTGFHYYKGGDEGVISAISGNGRVSFTWDSTSRVSTFPLDGWLEAVEVLPGNSGYAPLKKRDVGSRVQALKGFGFKDPSSGVRYYNGEDFGVLSGVANERVYVTWNYSDRVSNHPALEWLTVFRIVRDLPAVSLPCAGARVQSLNGQKLTGCLMGDYYAECEPGRVKHVDDTHIHVTWETSGLSTLAPVSTWLQHMKPL